MQSLAIEDVGNRLRYIADWIESGENARRNAAIGMNGEFAVPAIAAELVHEILRGSTNAIIATADTAKVVVGDGGDAEPSQLCFRTDDIVRVDRHLDEARSNLESLPEGPANTAHRLGEAAWDTGNRIVHFRTRPVDGKCEIHAEPNKLFAQLPRNAGAVGEYFNDDVTDVSRLSQQRGEARIQRRLTAGKLNALASKVVCLLQYINPRIVRQRFARCAGTRIRIAMRTMEIALRSQFEPKKIERTQPAIARVRGGSPSEWKL